MKTVNNKEELDIVNPEYWYDESDNFKVLLSYIKHMKHSLSEQSSGLVLKSDKDLYTNEGYSFSLGIKLVISNITQEVFSTIEILKNKVAEIIAWNKQQLQNNHPENVVKQHKMLFPLNIFNCHWAALEVVLTFMPQEENFVIAEEITVNVYDSSSAFKNYNRNYLARIHKMLDQALKDFAVKPKDFVYSGSWLTTKKQPDISSCGPITCKSILDLIVGASIPGNSIDYTAEEIHELRLAQINSIDDPEFTKKQQADQVAKLANKVSNEDAVPLAKAIYVFINNPLSEVFTNIKELVEAERAAQLVNNSHHIATAEELALTEINYREQLRKIKQWFNTNYDKLKAENILQNFFRVPENKPAADDMEWVDNGTDKLIEVFEKLLRIASANDEINEAKTDPEEGVRPLLLSNKLKSHWTAGAMRVIFDGKKDLYHYAGTAITSDNGTNIDCQPWNESIGSIYNFKGELHNGLKTVGDESYNHSDLRQITTFVGTRDSNGKPLNGIIKCFIGEKMQNDAYLLYDGFIEAGKFNDEATLYMVDNDSCYPGMTCNFDKDVLINQLEVTQNKDILVTSEDAEKNAKLLAKLQEAIDSDTIMIHLLMYVAEKNVIFPIVDDLIFRARNVIVGKYKQPEQPKSLKKYPSAEEPNMAGEESDNDDTWRKDRAEFFHFSHAYKKSLVSNSEKTVPSRRRSNKKTLNLKRNKNW